MSKRQNGEGTLRKRKDGRWEGRFNAGVDESGKPISEDTLTRWCKREFGMTFAEYRNKNSMMALKIKLRRNQIKLSEKSASMAIWLGKQMLGQVDNPNDIANEEPVRIIVDV